MVAVQKLTATGCCGVYITLHGDISVSRDCAGTMHEHIEN